MSESNQSNAPKENSRNGDPNEKIADFDWAGFKAKYDDAMAKCLESERALYEEFNLLTKYFKVWAEAGSNYEAERSANRLETRTLHVKNSEAQLEEKRLHYEKVVEAFQNALKLLNGP